MNQMLIQIAGLTLMADVNVGSQLMGLLDQCQPLQSFENDEDVEAYVKLPKSYNGFVLDVQAEGIQIFASDDEARSHFFGEDEVSEPIKLKMPEEVPVKEPASGLEKLQEVEEKQEEQLVAHRSIDELNLTPGVKRKLKENGIQSISELISKTAAEIGGIKGLGAVGPNSGLTRVKRALSKEGLTLAD